MFDEFRQKTKKERTKTLKTAGNVAVGLVGAAALGWILGNMSGFKSGVYSLLEMSANYNEQKRHSEEEDEDEGEA